MRAINLAVGTAIDTIRESGQYIVNNSRGEASIIDVIEARADDGERVVVQRVYALDLGTSTIRMYRGGAWTEIVSTSGGGGASS